MSEANTAMVLAKVNEAGLTMVVEPTEAEERLHKLQDFVRRNMVEGEDFGVIPGTRGQDGKPPRKTLLQPGAQKLAEIYGLAVTFEDARPPIERWDGDDPMFGYFKIAKVSRRTDGAFLGSGMGSCNSREKKYAARWVFERDVPPHLDIDRLPKREGKSKTNNKPFTMYKVPNPEIFDLVNTIEKMACKRALVGAVIAVTRSAGIFTQDMEEHAQEAPPQRAARGEVVDAEFEEPRRQEPTRQMPPVDPEVAAAAALSADIKRRLDAAETDESVDAIAGEIVSLPEVLRPERRVTADKRRAFLAVTTERLDAIQTSEAYRRHDAKGRAFLDSFIAKRREELTYHAQPPAPAEPA